MMDIKRKTVDADINKVLISTYRTKTDLLWDRAERQQPQDGFARMFLSCHDCYLGPCRLSPFGDEDKQTICGLSKKELVEKAIIADVTEGQQGLAQLLALCEKQAALEINPEDDHFRFDLSEILPSVSESAAASLEELASEGSYTVKGGLGSLSSECANLVLYGHFNPDDVKAFSDSDINVCAAGGAAGYPGVNQLTPYLSQEAPLYTGLADAVVIGLQDVLPSVIKMAEEHNIPVFHLSDDPEEIIKAAEEAFKKRRTSENIFAEPKTLKVSGLKEAAEIAGKAEKGAVFLGGTGHFSHTQGNDAVTLAKKLIGEGFAVISAGSIGLSLALAGLPEESFAYLGGFENTGLFLKIGGSAIFTEIVGKKELAAAFAFASRGIKTCIERPEFFINKETEETLNELNIFSAGVR